MILNLLEKGRGFLLPDSAEHIAPADVSEKDLVFGSGQTHKKEPTLLFDR